MVNLPNFNLRREKLRPVQFIPVSHVFQPMIGVRAKNDVSGWADRKRRLKWAMSAGKVYYVDEATAKDFYIKGYVDVVEGNIPTPTEDEIAEAMATVTKIQLGA